MDTTRSSGHEQVEDPTKINHPEEEEQHESGASKMYKRVKARAKKFKNRLTKNGNEPEPDHDVEEEEEEEEDDDENDDQEPQKHLAPGVTGQPESSLSHPRETEVPVAPEKKKVSPDVSSDYSKLDEPETLRDASYGHEALSRPVRSEETRDAPPAYPGKTSDLTDVEESRVPLSTPETAAFAPPGEYLGRQPEVNTESESGVSDYQSKVTDPTHQGGGEAGVPEITESVGRMKVMEESFDQKSESETAKDYPAVRSFGFDQKTEESGIDKDSPAAIFGGNPGAETREDIPAKSHEFEQVESGIGKDSPTRFGGKPEAERKEGFPAKSHGFEQTIGTEVGKDTGVGEPGTERREDFLGKNYEFEKELESAIGKDSPTRFAGESETGLGEGFSLKNDSIGKESESGPDKFPAASDDVKAETGLGRDFKTEFNEQFSPEFSGPKERDNFDSEAEPKPNTYTEMIGSATTSVTGKAVAAKDTVASSLGYSGETAGHESPVGVETPADKSIPDEENVKDIGSPFATKLPLSGGGSGAEEKYVQTSDYLPEKEKLTPEEEDKAFSEMINGKLNLGGEKKTTEAKEVEVTAEKIPSGAVSEEKELGETAAPEVEGGGGGMVGKIKGAYNYWLGGTTEEVKPKSPVSGHESSQSLDSTAGTKGSSDSGETGLGEIGGSTGASPVQKGL